MGRAAGRRGWGVVFWPGAGAPAGGGNLSQPQASAAPSTPEEEGALVGVWVPYFSLDTAEHTQAAFEENFQTIAQTAQEKGANALFVHVRSFSDALYPSQYYPWSHILTGPRARTPALTPWSL